MVGESFIFRNKKKGEELWKLIKMKSKGKLSVKLWYNRLRSERGGI